MSLGNWAGLSINNEGKCENSIPNYLGSTIEIYKNYILVRNEKLWQEEFGFVKPIITQIQEGDLKIAGFDIKAKRGMQKAVFLFTEYYTKKDWTDKIYFAGLGCYGYVGDGWVDVLPSTVKEFVNWLEIFNNERRYDEKWKIWLEKAKKFDLHS